MKHRKWLILFVALALMAGTVGALTQLRATQKLGVPGVKGTPIPGGVMIKMELPERVLDFASTNVPESEIELGFFPKDTSYVRRFYQAPDGLWSYATIVLMGADRTSIHRPEYCLPGQGWTIGSKTAVNIPIGGEHPYELQAFKWIIHNISQAQDGQKQEVGGVYVFWFVADNEQTANYVQFQYYLLRDLLLTGRLQRWAYVSYYAACPPGQEEATFERIKKLISASVPEYQLPLVKR